MATMQRSSAALGNPRGPSPITSGCVRSSPDSHIRCHSCPGHFVDASCVRIDESVNFDSLLDGSSTSPTMRSMSHHAGVRLAEVGFLLLLFAGVWLTSAQIPLFKFARGRTIVAGVALALSGVLLIAAVH
jgi:hypothetical protein